MDFIKDILISIIIYKDLNIEKGEPISYHAIVYEVPLPERHWYNWPNSRSRLVSNGCHWIDHFLFLNDYSKPEKYDVWKSSRGEVIVTIELKNGAFFSMTLTDIGSERIGVQDYIELRAKDTTIKITNSSKYVAENSQKIIKKKKTNKLNSYKNMYKTIVIK